MKTIGIFYGSETGVTADIAHRIAQRLNVDSKDIHNVAEASPSQLGNYDILVLGSSTWGAGELQSDWYNFLDGAQSLDLTGHKIAIFGTGDESMSDSFCNAVGLIYDTLTSTGAEFIAPFNADGYDFTHSDAEKDGTYVGLLLDQVSHPDLTNTRIEAWTKEIIENI